MTPKKIETTNNYVGGQYNFGPPALSTPGSTIGDQVHEGPIQIMHNNNSSLDFGIGEDRDQKWGYWRAGVASLAGTVMAPNGI
jgi:hypothetical protein